MSKCREENKTVCRDVTPCSLGGMYCLNLQGGLNTMETDHHPQDGGSKTLRNADSYPHSVRSHKTIILTATTVTISNPKNVKVET
jgi:hypothetical protein